MQQIKTPLKEDDGITRLKQSLSARWGMRFAARDNSWSPSKRDPTSLDDKIHGCIQYLFWRKGNEAAALDYALAQFERHAPAIVADWVFKPRAEADVIPTRSSKDSSVNREFLKRRNELTDDNNQTLKQCLLQKLNEVADKLKRGASYITVPTIMPSIEESGNKDPIKKAKPNAGKPAPGLRQTSITLWSRSKSAPNPPTSSSDEYPADESDFVNLDVTKVVASGPANKIISHESEDNAHTEAFQTPPTSPLKAIRSGNSTSDTGNNGSMLPPDGRKRRFEPLPKSQDAPQDSNKRRSTSRNQHYISEAVETVDDQSPLVSFKSDISAASSETTPSNLASTFTSPQTSFSTVYSNDSKRSSFDFSPGGDSDMTIQAVKQSSRQLNTIEATSSLTDVDIRDVSSNTAASPPKPSGLKETILSRLHNHPPFGESLPRKFASLPFRQTYELLRVCQRSKVDLHAFGPDLQKEISDYPIFWALMAKVVKAQGASMPEKSSLLAWEAAGQQSDRLALSGKLRFNKDIKGPLLSFKLNAFRMEPSCRVVREFGSGRFCTVSFPGFMRASLPEELSKDAETSKSALIQWLVETKHRLLGRTWRAFFPKEDGAASKKKGLQSFSDDRFKIYMFAEDGQGFRTGPLNGELDPRLPNHEMLSVEKLLDWFMHAKTNRDHAALKLFSRLQLAVSKTTPTIELSPNQIYSEYDTRADNPEPRRLTNDRSKTSKAPPLSNAPSMNDGCARLSKGAASDVVEYLGLDYTPAAFQGRFGSAKGMWMVDLDPSRKDEKWIEVTESQSKFGINPKDIFSRPRAKFTFEINEFVKPLRPSSLSISLMLILQDRGVAVRILEDMLEADLSTAVGELQASMDSPLSVKYWNQQHSRASVDNTAADALAFLGGLPVSPSEIINWFIDHGFDPKECRYLRDQLFDAIRRYRLQLEQRMKIEVPSSTYAYIIADPLAVLEENEIHLCFSSPFPNAKSGLNDLDDLDVLVSRSPAYLPSDVQKVHAVFKPELRSCRDVIVFSSKGETSLASKLSGGDYDGDKCWICWDSRLVEPFHNAEVPAPTPLEVFGIEKDSKSVADFLDNRQQFTTNFITHGFEFNLQPSLLGTCSNYHQSLCYQRKCINSPEAIEIANLLGLLVDSGKGGFIFSEAKWSQYLKSKGLKKTLKRPAYKSLDPANSNKHFIDHLMFTVARKASEDALKTFDQKFSNAHTRDQDLLAAYEERIEDSKDEAGFSDTLRHVGNELELIMDTWKRNTRLKDSDKQKLGAPAEDTGERFRAAVISCRQMFCDIAPIPPDSIISFSPTIQNWAREHARGQSLDWPYLKALIAFKRFHQTNMIWHIAGLELAEIKARSKGIGTYRTTVNDIASGLKVSGKVVAARRGREDMDSLLDDVEGHNEEAHSTKADDDDYGSWPSDYDFDVDLDLDFATEYE
ncbi:uncharacterized protein KY384_005164 [Bacidia gigantensis]|uniref:uncharacterized protein n=1 Tax=Bacidia gigantensis TaxID=2732470 RepID=UPI001D05309C|nr:uncharacterized protein KY384_005164 [Bacidia gigantensis]KAG8529683.1 hypothetical protein KY384_005164 [Bacidia gigantensis]